MTFLAPVRRYVLFVATLLATTLSAGATSAGWKLDFGFGSVAAGYTAVRPDMIYTTDRGFGFEPGGSPQGVDRRGSKALTADFVTSNAPFLFSVAVPEGNYRVTATLGDAKEATVTTIKAELRRLMVERVATQPGEFKRVSFIVNTRSPTIAAVGGIKAGRVDLKAPRETELEAFAWDDKLTLEFGNSHPALCALEIEPVTVPTIFLLGDSTVCDQPREPYASWGQMLPRFFKPEVAIANHAESGESYTASLARRRIDKIASLLRPGDVVIMQFGHNDQKEHGPGDGPFLNYTKNIAKHVAMIRARGGIPVIISPMERRNFDERGRVKPTLADYAVAAKQAAAENHAAFIDLHAASIPFYEWLEAKGKDDSRKAFAGMDNTHQNNYGAYEFAKVIAQGLRDDQLEIARYLADDFRGFDPQHPDDPETFPVPPSAGAPGPRPLGN